MCAFPYWIARARGVDLRETGSRKLGGSNLGATVGPLHGIAGGIQFFNHFFPLGTALTILALQLTLWAAFVIYKAVVWLLTKFHILGGSSS